MVNSAPEPEPPRTPPAIRRTDDDTAVLPPYPTAPAATPPGPWPGLVYLGSDRSGADPSGANGPGAGRPAIPATVLIAPAIHTDTDDTDDTTPGPVTALYALAASFAPPGAAIAVLVWPARPHPTTVPSARGARIAPTLVPAAWTEAGEAQTPPMQNEPAPDTTRADTETVPTAPSLTGAPPMLLRLAPSTITTSAAEPARPERHYGPATTTAATTATATATTTTTTAAATAAATTPRAEALPALPPTSTTPRLRPPSPSLDLIITSVAPDEVDEARMGAAAVAAAGTLRCGGLLLVLTHSDHDREGRLLDPGGLIVSTAQNADLLYFQHIVTIDALARDGRDPADDTRGPGDTPQRRLLPPPGSGRPAVHRRAHRDLYVFGQQHDHHAAVPAGDPLDDPVVDAAAAAPSPAPPAAAAVAPPRLLPPSLESSRPSLPAGPAHSTHPTDADHTDPIPTRGSFP